MFDDLGVEWRVIADYDVYEVSEYGQVRRAGRILKPRTRTGSRWRYALCKNGRPRDHSAAVLVAQAFLGPAPFASAFVCHKDDNLANNHYTNLYWGTQNDNSRDAIINGRTRFGIRHQNAKLTNEQVSEIRRLYNEESLTYKDIAALFSVTPSNIHYVIYEKTWADDPLNKPTRSISNVRRGEYHAHAKLSYEKAEAIREEYRAGNVTERTLMHKYGVTVATIHNVLTYRTWRTSES